MKPILLHSGHTVLPVGTGAQEEAINIYLCSWLGLRMVSIKTQHGMLLQIITHTVGLIQTRAQKILMEQDSMSSLLRLVREFLIFTLG